MKLVFTANNERAARSPRALLLLSREAARFAAATPSTGGTVNPTSLWIVPDPASGEPSPM